MNKINKKNFIFSVSTNAFQIEGGRNLGGRTDSIWDEFTKRNFKIPPIGSNEREINSIEMAADFYHKYKTDAKIMNNLGINGFIYNMDWNRIFPKNWEYINPEGLKWTIDMFDEMNNNKIQPIPILFHWDTPLWAEIQGGWNNREILKWFRNYVKTVFKYLGKKSDLWYVNDENSTFTLFSYLDDFMPPAKKDEKSFVEALHMLNMSGAVAKEEFELAKIKGYVNKEAKLGIDHDWSPPIIWGNNDNDDEIIKTFNIWMKYLFLDPNFKGIYPEELIKFANKHNFFIPNEDLEYLKKYTCDFIGWNYYRPTVITSEKNINDSSLFINEPKRLFNTNVFIVSPKEGFEYTKWNWLIDPSMLVSGANELYGEYKVPLMIVENGYGDFDDKNSLVIKDIDRIEYLKKHIEQVFIAIEKGIDFIGYSTWTYCDIFSPSAGYRKDYGLVSVDFNSPIRKRKPKLSYCWYKQLIKTGETEYNETELIAKLEDELKKWTFEME